MKEGLCSNMVNVTRVLLGPENFCSYSHYSKIILKYCSVRCKIVNLEASRVQKLLYRTLSSINWHCCTYKHRDWLNKPMLGCLALSSFSSCYLLPYFHFFNGKFSSIAGIEPKVSLMKHLHCKSIQPPTTYTNAEEIIKTN